MGIGYQTNDRKILDYRLWTLPNVPEVLRGPRRWSSQKPYLSFLGAAQTFGRFAQHPFAESISRALGVEHLNFGSAGAGPEYYLKKAGILAYVNESSLCVIQIMSGRSVSTSLLESIGGGGMLKFRNGLRAGQSHMAADAYRLLLKEYGQELATRQVAEAREQWVRCYQQLIDLISVPVVLLWMSTRRTNQPAELGEDGGLGEFPHLIRSQELSAIQRSNVTVVEAIVDRNTYMPLVNKLSGEPEIVYDRKTFPSHPDWARDINNYYYVQHQHDQVATVFVRACLAEENSRLRSIILTAGK